MAISSVTNQGHTQVQAIQKSAENQPMKVKKTEHAEKPKEAFKVNISPEAQQKSKAKES